MGNSLVLGIFLLGASVGALCDRLHQTGIRTRSVRDTERRFHRAHFDKLRVESGEEKATSQAQTNLVFLPPGKTGSRRKNA
jgi:hypothetical protein